MVSTPRPADRRVRGHGRMERFAPVRTSDACGNGSRGGWLAQILTQEDCPDEVAVRLVLLLDEQVSTLLAEDKLDVVGA
jgi:hypothetical protein